MTSARNCFISRILVDFQTFQFWKLLGDSPNKKELFWKIILNMDSLVNLISLPLGFTKNRRKNGPDCHWSIFEQANLNLWMKTNSHNTTHSGQLIKGAGEKTVPIDRNEWKFGISLILCERYHTLYACFAWFLYKALFLPKIEEIRQFSAFSYDRKTQKSGLQKLFYHYTSKRYQKVPSCINCLEGFVTPSDHFYFHSISPMKQMK